jgi:alpha/beta hydrolase fold
MSDSKSHRATPHAPIADIVRVVAASLFFVLLATLRRLIGLRRRPAWSFRLELLIAAYRGSWSVMLRMGIVRWRNVGEAMSPLRTDRLEPRFVQLGSGPGESKGRGWNLRGRTDRSYCTFTVAASRLHRFAPTAISSARWRAPRRRARSPSTTPRARAPRTGCDRRRSGGVSLPAGAASTREAHRARRRLGGWHAGAQHAAGAARWGEPLPAAGVALSPWVDLACSGASFQTNAAFDFVGHEHCTLAAASYLAGADARRPDLSPLFAELQGLPPLLVHVGEAEVLRDQVQSFVERAKAAGVDIELAIYPAMVHVWHMMRNATPDAQRAIDHFGGFVEKHAR